MENNMTTQPAKVRVSIFERIVPFGAMAVAAIGGGAGGPMIMWLMDAYERAENVGVGTVSIALFESLLPTMVCLYLAAALGVVAICVPLGRLGVETKTASPSGISYLVLALLSLVPVAFVWQAGSLIIAPVVAIRGGIETGGISESAETINALCIAAIVAAPIVLIILLTWSLIPFKAKPGRRFGPIICLILVELALIAITVAFQLRILELNSIFNAEIAT